MAGDGFDGLDHSFAAELKALFAAAPGGAGITSGFRTGAEQAQLYAQKPNLAAPPGSSWHEKGYAADLRFASQDVLNWAHQHAAEYGLFFPMDYEPWHIQPLWTKGRKASEADTSGTDGFSTPPDDHTPADDTGGDTIGNLLGGFRSALSAPEGNEMSHPQAETPWGSWGATAFAKRKAGADSAVAGGNGQGLVTPNTGGGGLVDRILKVIRTKESGGNYKAPPNGGGASGAYQFINSTWLGAGGGKFAPRADLATPAQQDEIARGYVQRILDANNGDVRSIPATWYVGHYDPNNMDYVPAPEAGNKLSVRAYSNGWLDLFNQYSGTDTTETANAPGAAADGNTVKRF